MFFHSIAYAQSITEGSPISAAEGGFVESIQDIYTYAQGLGVALAVAMIALGGIYIAISGASPDKQKEGKDMITSAIWGLVLLFSAALVLRTVNPRLVNFSLSTQGGLRPCNAGEVPDVDNPQCELVALRTCAFGEVPDVDNPQCELADNAPQYCPRNITDPCFANPVLTYDFTFVAEDGSSVAAGERIAEIKEAFAQHLRDSPGDPFGFALASFFVVASGDFNSFQTIITRFINEYPLTEVESIAEAGVHTQIPGGGHHPSKLHPGFRYKRIPYYPTNGGPRNTACILVAYETDGLVKNEEGELEKGIKVEDFKNRNGLTRCPYVSPPAPDAGANAGDGGNT